jgi:hypothetical protein
MEKEVLVRLILGLHAEMKDLTIQAGVDPEKYQTILDVMEAGVQPDLMELHTWLTEIYKGPYDNVLKVWERHKPETWRQFEIMQVNNLAEQVLLRKRYRELRQAWKGAPRAKKRKIAKSENSDSGESEMHLRSEGARADESGS